MGILKKTTTKKKSAFPETLLKKWLKGRKHWNHDDWLHLLNNLGEEGYEELISSEENLTKIGQFLETEREIT